MKKRLFPLLLFFLLAAKLSAGQNFSFFIRPQFGINSIRFNEFLYAKEPSPEEAAKTLSLLIWESDLTPLAKLSTGMKFKDSFFFQLEASYNLPFYTDCMQDFDWANLISTGEKFLTHYSLHENKLDNFYDFNFMLGYGGKIKDTLKLYQIISFHYSYFSSTASNGYRQYGQTLGKTDGKEIYAPWTSDIEAIYMEGKNIKIEKQDYSLGLGLKLVYDSKKAFHSELSLQVLPSIDSRALDTHFQRSFKYTFFDSISNIAFASSFLLDYKLNNNHRLNARADFNYCSASCSDIVQSTDKNNWLKVSNPGGFKLRCFSFLLGYTYFYEA